MSVTPGPWTTGGVSDPLSILSTVSYFQVAAVNDAMDEAEANARLIAAAPEMFDALMVVRMSRAWHEMSDELCAVVQSAIAKARGES